MRKPDQVTVTKFCNRRIWWADGCESLIIDVLWPISKIPVWSHESHARGLGMTELQGRTALITGGTGGIGRGIAEVFGSAGANVALHGISGEPREPEAVASVRHHGSPAVRFFEADLRNHHEIALLMKRVHLWRPVDILVNNAGVQTTNPLATMTSQEWDEIIAVNLSAAFHTMKSAMPFMARQGYGRVINISSVHGLVASVNKAPYTAAKFGLVGLSRVAALEYAEFGDRKSGGVTINCICPGWTETPLIEPQVMARATELGIDRTEAIAHLLSEKQPSRRTSTPTEIGDLALWLCSRSAHNVTGAAIPMDGGWTSQ